VEDLRGCDGLVIPGGESTAIGLIAERNGMVCLLPVRAPPHCPSLSRPPGQLAPLREWVASRKPTWGTCAGMIMLAENIAGGGKEGGQALLGGVPITVNRNFFGAQAASFEAPLRLAEDASLRACLPDGFTGVFIRAPSIASCGEAARPLAWVNRRARDASAPAWASDAGPSGSDLVIVAAESGPFLVTAFHPELVSSSGWHAYFGQKVQPGGTGGSPTPVGQALADRTVPDAYMGHAATSNSLDLARRVVPGQRGRA